MKSSRLVRFRAALLLLSFCAVIGSSRSWSQVYVFNTATLATGNNPQAMVSSDVNGDGTLDLVIANYNDNTVSVVLGNPDGSYQAKVDYPVGSQPVALALADFNKDGKIDLAVVNNNCPSIPCTAVGSISTLLGNGDGTFQSHVDKNVGNSPNGLVSGDFNRDGFVDLAVTNGQDNTVSILIGNNDGTFKLNTNLAAGVNPHGVVVIDFNGDGFQDLVVANQGDSTIGMFMGGAKGFHSQTTFATGPNPVALAVADVNQDGKPDVLTANSGASSISVMIHSFNGGFADHVDFTTKDKVTAIAVGDFNGDGLVDIAAAATASNAISVLWGKGDGSFFFRADFATGSAPAALAAADFTGDGRIDLAIANSLDNTVHILPGLGALALQNRTTIPTGNAPNGIATCDFNLDGNLDMAVADRSDNALMILLGNGTGTFTALPSSPTTGLKPSSVIAVDLNKDNHCDLVATNAGDGTVSVFLGNGDGTFGGATLLTAGKKPVSVVAADFNKDGNLDLAVVNQNDLTVSIFLGNGNGTFQPQRVFFTGPATNPSWVVADDFGNGKIDLAISDSGTGTVSVLLGAGDGTFSNPLLYPTGAGASSVAIGDFNGDGKKDLAVTNNGANTVSILPGNGNGTFQSHVDFPTAKGPFFVTAVDLNNDGKLDLAIGASSSGSNRVSIMLGNGDGTFQPHVDHGTVFVNGGLSEQLAVADFNNDGVPDIAAADQFANFVSLFLNSAVPTLFPAGLNFGVNDLGVPSAPQTSTLTNVGSAPLNNLAPPVVSTDYSMASDCGTSLAVGASCATQVTFTATDVGAINGTLTYTDSAPDSPQVSLLTATGNGAGAGLNVTSLTFPVTVVNVASAKQNVILTNYGNQTLTLTIIPPGPNFILNHTCGTSLPAGRTCTITVAFRPKTSGLITDTVTITDNAWNSPQTISLTGTGTIAKLTPTSLGFGNVTVGTSSTPQNITLTNVGNRTLNSIVITIVGTNASDFSLAPPGTCGSSLPKLSSCTISVTFTPTAIGLRTASVSVADDGGGSPQTASLSGTGQ